MNWWKNLKGKVILREPLKKHTSFKIGGPAKFFIMPYAIADLKFIIASAKSSKLPISVIGAGSNILVNDKGVEAIVLQLNSPFFKRISCKRNYLKTSCGVTVGKLIQEAGEHNLSGLEFLAGIPGTIGGALAMNAGAWGKNIGDLVENVQVMDYDGNVKTLDKREIKFGYRSSNLEKFIILDARLKLAKRNKKEITRQIKKYLAHRRNTQDKSLPNAGCVFKNPSYKSAGRLIDLCGLKGKRVGGACVSGRHGNFIMNCGNASANDVLKLMGLIKKRVRNKFNVILEPEIKIWQ